MKRPRRVAEFSHNASARTTVVANAFTAVAGEDLLAIIWYAAGAARNFTLADTTGSNDSWNELESGHYDAGNGCGFRAFLLENAAAGTCTLVATVTASQTVDFPAIAIISVPDLPSTPFLDMVALTQASPGTGDNAVSSGVPTYSDQPSWMIGLTIDIGSTEPPLMAGTRFRTLGDGPFWDFEGAAVRSARVAARHVTTPVAATFCGSKASGTSTYQTIGIALKAPANDESPTALKVDQWMDFENSTDGTEVTNAILAGGCWKGRDLTAWVTMSNPSAQTPGAVPNITIEADAQMSLPGEVIVDGEAAVADSGTRGIRCSMSQNGCLQLNIKDPGFNFALGFCMRFNGPAVDNGPRDICGLRSDPTGNYQFGQLTDNTGGNPQAHSHWQPGGSGIGSAIAFQRVAKYWVALKHVFGSDTCEVQVRDLATGAFIGSSTGSVSTGTKGCTTIQIGIINYGADGSQSLDIDNVVLSTDPLDHPLLPAWPLPPATLGQFDADMRAEGWFS